MFRTAVSLAIAVLVSLGCSTISRNTEPAFAALAGTTSMTSTDWALFELSRDQRQGARYTIKSPLQGDALPYWRKIAIVPKGTNVRVLYFGEPYGIGASGTIYAFLELDLPGVGRVEASKAVTPGRTPYW